MVASFLPVIVNKKKQTNGGKYVVFLQLLSADKIICTPKIITAYLACLGLLTAMTHREMQNTPAPMQNTSATFKYPANTRTRWFHVGPESLAPARYQASIGSK